MNYSRIGWNVTIDCAIRNLLRHMIEVPIEDLVRSLAAVGRVLHCEHDIAKVNQILMEKFALGSVANRNLFVQMSNNDFQQIIFTHDALKLLNELLLLNIHCFVGRSNIVVGSSFNSRPIYFLNKLTGLYEPNMREVSTGKEVSIIGLFCLANRIVHVFSQDLRDGFSDSVRDYYSRIIDDPIVAIGRSDGIYDNVFFNEHLKKEFGISSRELVRALFGLYVSLRKDNIIVFDVTFRGVFNNDRAMLEVVRELLVIEPFQSYVLDRSSSDIVRNAWLKNKLSRARPLIRLGEKYFCLDLNLLITALCDLPLHLLLKKYENDKHVGDAVHVARGNAYEQYVRELAESVFSKKHIEHPSIKADLHFELSQNVLFLAEVKNYQETDAIKQGCITGVIKKFIIPENNEKKGALQVMRHANKLRSLKKSPYRGEIYTAVIFYGRFPEIDEFDIWVEQNFIDKADYQTYSSNVSNHRTIWFNGYAAEMFFSAIKQGADPIELLQFLFQKKPSQVSAALEQFMCDKGLKYSYGKLFEDELKLLTEKCKGMFKEEHAC